MPRPSLVPATGHAPRQAFGADSNFACPGTPLALPRIAPDGTFAGYASLFERPDLSGDSIAPGAFRESLARRGAGAVRMLFQHDSNQPIGVWQKVLEDRQGLYVQGRLVLEVDRAREVLALLRGQAGTEHAMRAPLAAGARFVLLDGGLARVDLTLDELGLLYSWRCGPAARALGDATYTTASHAFRGEGLRPLAPVHVRGQRVAGGDLLVTWVRRTRMAGDGWEASEVPLGEEGEAYAVDILAGVSVVRTLTSTTNSLTYSAAEQVADFGAPQAAVSLRIAQVSATFGRGTPASAVL